MGRTCALWHRICWSERVRTRASRRPPSPVNTMKIWIPVAIVVIFLLAVAGLLPLPGQKDNVTPHSQPSAAGTSPQVEPPTGPPPSPAAQVGAGATQPPPGGTPSASPGGVSNATSGQTMTGDTPQRGASTSAR